MIKDIERARSLIFKRVFTTDLSNKVPFEQHSGRIEGLGGEAYLGMPFSDKSNRNESPESSEY